MTSARIEAELAELLDRVSARDEAAFRRLYELASPRMFGLALHIVRQRAAAEDVLQESFITVWRAAGNFQGALSPPMAWMGMIVRSRAIEVLRRRVTDRSTVTQEFEGETADTLLSTTPEPWATVDASRQALALRNCLDRLDSKHKQAIILAYLRDMTHSELAEHVKVPIGTIKTWIRRGLATLRDCMKGFA